MNLKLFQKVYPNPQFQSKLAYFFGTEHLYMVLQKCYLEKLQEKFS